MRRKTKEKVRKIISDFFKEEIIKIENSKVRAIIFVIYFSYIGIELILYPYHVIAGILFWTFVSYLLISIFLRIYFSEFYNSKYRRLTNNSFFDTFYDLGREGEFYTYNEIEKFEKLDKNNKILLNLYIPKNDSTFSEIDIILLNKTGIYVFESKNIAGWIFGSQNDDYWTIVYKNNRRIKMYNPIIQNRYHIKYLKEILNDEKIEYNYFKSYIVFSERCEIKKINIHSNNIKALKRNRLYSVLENDIKKSNEVFTDEQIKNLYLKLLKYMVNDESITQEHINNVRKKYSKS